MNAKSVAVWCTPPFLHPPPTPRAHSSPPPPNNLFGFSESSSAPKVGLEKHCLSRPRSQHRLSQGLNVGRFIQNLSQKAQAHRVGYTLHSFSYFKIRLVFSRAAAGLHLKQCS